MRCSHCRNRWRHSRRRGTVLLLFAVLLFVFLPILALVVHLGLVINTRRNMQSATDAAALEGLRWRDELPPGAEANYDPTSPEDRDVSRRDAALESLNQQIRGLAGGRSEINFSGGIPLAGVGINVGQRVTLDPIGPVGELNLDNNPAGDMVSGTYDPLATSHAEGSDYSRDDFAPVGDNAFLVRLRRSSETDIPGEIRALEPVPFFFGRAGITRAVNRDDPAALWRQRQKGTTVRATSIASARPALWIGPHIDASTVPGYTGPVVPGFRNFALRWNVWQAWEERSVQSDTDLVQRVRLTEEGLLIAVDASGEPEATDDPIGQFLPRQTAIGCWVGQQVPVPSPIDPNNFWPSSSVDVLVPLYRELAGVNRIVAFGRVNLEPDAGADVVVRPQFRHLAARNASPRLPRQVTADELGVWEVPPDLEPHVLADILLQPDSPILLAPALERAID